MVPIDIIDINVCIYNFTNGIAMYEYALKC